MDIRNVTMKDVAAICNIYNYYIENTFVSFETIPLQVEEMRVRINDVLEDGFPWYVAVVEDQIIGYAYMHSWNKRAAYNSSKEVSVYLDHTVKGKGYGTKLYEYLFERIDRTNTHALIATICIPNAASVKLHERFGFKQVSHFKEIGRKFNQWKDVGHWQLIL